MKTGKQASGLSLGFDRFSGLYLWALFILVFGIWRPDLFLTQATVHSIASSQAIVAIMGLAVLVPLAAGVFDLSIGATVNITAVTVAVLQTQHNLGVFESILVSVAMGAFIGVVNGLLVVVLRVNSFIATLATATVIGAVQVIITQQRQPLPPTSSTWNALTQKELLGGFQIVVLYLLVLALLVWWLLDHTPAGRYIYAVGGNAEAARLSGVRVGKWQWLAFIFSGTICGLAGVMYSSLNGPSLTFGASLLLPAYAAAFLGSTQIKPGRFNVWGSLIAVYVLYTGVYGLRLVTSVQWLNDMFNGVALAAAVAFAAWRQRTAVDRRRTSAGGAAGEADPAPAPESGAVEPPVRSWDSVG